MRYSEYTISVTYLTKILSRRTCVFTDEKSIEYENFVWYDTNSYHYNIIKSESESCTILKLVHVKKWHRD